MPSSSNPLNLVVVALLGFMGGIAGLIGAAGFFSPGTGEIRWVFGMMLLSAVGMVYGAVSSYRSWKRATAAEIADRQSMAAGVAMAKAASRNAPPPMPPLGAGPPGEAPSPLPPRAGKVLPPMLPPGAEPPPEVLAHWTYDADEWSAYAGREVRFRSGEALWQGVGIAILGTLILGVAEGDWAVGATVSIAIGAIVGAGRWLVARTAHDANALGPGEVTITRRAVLMNGRYHTLGDERFRFDGVRLREHETPPVLEFTVSWQTRSGRANEQVRVPVPRGREDEARRVLAAFVK